MSAAAAGTPDDQAGPPAGSLMGEPSPSGRFGEFGGPLRPGVAHAGVPRARGGLPRRVGRPRLPRRARPPSCATTAAGPRRSPSATGCRSVSGCGSCSSARTWPTPGSHKLNNVIGQALLARRMGKRRLIAETGAGQHGVAAATAAALFGMECVVYMGEVDTDAPGAQRVPHGAARRRGAPRARREPHAQGRRQRGAAGLGGERGRHPLLPGVGHGARIPIRGWCASCSGWWATRPACQCRAMLGGADPDWVVACIGGGSNAAGTFAGFVDTGAELVGVEAAGGAAMGRGVPGVVHGMKSYVLQDEVGQISEASVDLGRARLSRDRSRARPSVGHRAGPLRAGRRRRGAGRLPAAVGDRGHHPRPRARPRPGVAGARGGHGRCPPGATVLVTLSGRGDKDVAQVRDMLR